MLKNHYTIGPFERDSGSINLMIDELMDMYREIENGKTQCLRCGKKIKPGLYFILGHPRNVHTLDFAIYCGKCGLFIKEASRKVK